MSVFQQARARIGTARLLLASVRAQDHATVSLLQSTALIELLLRSEIAGKALNSGQWASLLTQLVNVDFLEDDRSAIVALARRSAQNAKLTMMPQRISPRDDDLDCDLQICGQNAASVGHGAGRGSHKRFDLPIQLFVAPPFSCFFVQLGGRPNLVVTTVFGQPPSGESSNFYICLKTCFCNPLLAGAGDL